MHGFASLRPGTYSLLGDGVGAEAELEHLPRLQGAAAEYAPSLAHAYLLQGRPELAIEEAAKAPPGIRPMPPHPWPGLSCPRRR